jgi:hypothetical protein
MLFRNVGDPHCSVEMRTLTTLRRTLLKIKTDLGETGREAVTGFIWLRIGTSGYVTTLSVSKLSI